MNKEHCNKTKERINDLTNDIFFDKKKFKEPLIVNDDAMNLLKYVKPKSIDLVVTSPLIGIFLIKKEPVDQKEIRKYSSSKDD